MACVSGPWIKQGRLLNNAGAGPALSDTSRAEPPLSVYLIFNRLPGNPIEDSVFPLDG